MKEEQKKELEMIIRSLEGPLDEVETENDRINIHDISVETTVLIKDLLANYIRKKSSK